MTVTSRTQIGLIRQRQLVLNTYLNGHTKMNLKRMATGLALMALLALVVVACGNDAAVEPEIDGAWARPGAEGDNAAAYMNITNEGDDDIILTGASSDVARMVEVHESRMEDGTMRMEEVPEIVVEAGDTVALEPGGYHVMFMHLEQDLEPGDSFMLTLHFEDLDDIELEVTVEEQ
jgi:periplasmic copper chaperone A